LYSQQSHVEIIFTRFNLELEQSKESVQEFSKLNYLLTLFSRESPRKHISTQHIAYIIATKVCGKRICQFTGQEVVSVGFFKTHTCNIKSKFKKLFRNPKILLDRSKIV